MDWNVFHALVSREAQHEYLNSANEEDSTLGDRIATRVCLQLQQIEQYVQQSEEQVSPSAE